MSKKVLIIIIIAGLFFLASMGGVFFLLWNKLASLESQNKEVVEEASEQEQTDSIGTIYSVDTFIANLASSNGKRYLRVTMGLDYNENELAEELDGRLPQIRDSILMILTTKRFEEVDNIDGKIALRNEIIEKLNSFLQKGSINNIYFTEFVIQ